VGETIKEQYKDLSSLNVVDISKFKIEKKSNNQSF